MHPHFEFLELIALLPSVVVKSKGDQFRENSGGCTRTRLWDLQEKQKKEDQKEKKKAML